MGALAVVARGQTLSLDKNEPPIPIAGPGAASLAAELKKEAAALLKFSRGGPPSGPARARAALRMLGAWCLSPEGSDPRRLLAGRTIALHRDVLDAAIGTDDSDPASLFAAEALARDLESCAAAADGEALGRGLRDALWPLLRADASDGTDSPPVPGAPGRPLHEQAALTTLAANDLVVVTAFEEHLRSAGAAGAYRPWEEALRHDASLALGALTPSSSRLLAPAVRELIAREVTGTMAAVSAGGAGALSAAGRLERLGLLCDCLVRAAALDQASAPSRALRGAVEEYALRGAWREDAGAAARLRRLSDVVARAVPDDELGDERTVARQFRPALRVLEPLARQSGVQTIDVAPRLLGGADAASDPAVLGAITAHARRIADLRLLRAAAGAVAPLVKGEPDVPASLRFLAERYVALGQDLGRPEKRDLAIAELRGLSAQVAAWKTMPGEDELRAQDRRDSWQRATGGRLAELVKGLDAARAAWMNSWSTPRSLPSAAVTRKLLTFRDALPVLADGAAALAVGDGASSAGELPEWELSAEGAAWLTAGLEGSLASLGEAVVLGNDEALAAVRKKLAGEFALALGVGRLERWARGRGAPAPRSQSDGAVAQLVFLWAPAEGWLEEARPDLAVMCAAIEEAAALERGGHAPEARAYRAMAERAGRAISARLAVERP